MKYCDNIVWIIQWRCLALNIFCLQGHLLVGLSEQFLEVKVKDYRNYQFIWQG